MFIKIKEQKMKFEPYVIEVKVDSIAEHEALLAMAKTNDTIPAEAAKFGGPHAKHTSEQAIEFYVKGFLNGLRPRLAEIVIKTD